MRPISADASDAAVGKGRGLLWTVPNRGCVRTSSTPEETLTHGNVPPREAAGCHRFANPGAGLTRPPAEELAASLQTSSCSGFSAQTAHATESQVLRRRGRRKSWLAHPAPGGGLRRPTWRRVFHKLCDKWCFKPDHQLQPSMKPVQVSSGLHLGCNSTLALAGGGLF